MSNSNFRNVSKAEPCPICGKPDWCSIQSLNSGEELNYCRRVLCHSNTINSITGESYIYIKEAKDGSCMYQNATNYEASKQKWLQTKYPNQSYKKNSSPPHINQRLETSTVDISLPVKSNYELDKIYRSFLNKLYLYKKHKDYFLKERWPSDLISSSLVRSLPFPTNKNSFDLSRYAITTELLQEFNSLEGVPGFYKKENGKWTFTGSSGILIPQFDYQKNLYRLRIRLDHPEKNKNGKEINKYHNFSSFFEKMQTDGTRINIYENGCRAGNHIGFYSNPDKDDFSVCYITEGEKKAIFANYVLQSPIISVPGVNSFSKILEVTDDQTNSLDYLKNKNCKLLIIAYDADRLINKHVLKYEQQLITFLTKQGFQIAVAFWNPGFGKGLDDILSINVRPNYELVSGFCEKMS